MINDYEKLFLIEILVNSVQISNDKLNLDPSIKSRLGDTCIMFQFLNYPTLVVCEDDVLKQHSQQTTKYSYKHGKSCLFSIASTVCPTLPAALDVVVNVMQKVDSPEGNQEITVGSVTIPMGDSFTSLIRSSDKNKENVPETKTKTGTYALMDSASNQIGSIAVFLRLSCFGQMIVTQIQLGGIDKETYMFKGTDYKNVYEIPGDDQKKPVLKRDDNKPCFSGVNEESYPASQNQLLNQGQPQTYFEKPQNEPQPCPCGPQCYPGKTQPPYPDDCVCNERYGGYVESQEVMNRGYDQQPPPSVKSNGQGNYKEIVAEIRGHALKIRIPRKSNKKQGEDKSYYSCQQLLDLQRDLQEKTSQCQCSCMAK